jgi:type II secretory pathway component PulF
MPVYKYRAKKGPNDIVEGRIEVHTEEEAIEKLSQMGYLPLRIEEESKSIEASVYRLGKLQGKIKSREITIFSRQLASLLKSGVPILNALNVISEQSENPTLKDILRNIHNAIREGATFSSVLSYYPNVFSLLYIAMVRTGENSGALPEALLRIADYRMKQEEMLSRFRMAMAYPILMAIVGVVTVVFMLTFVMPRLMGIFTSMGQELPLPTQILISISQTLRQWWFWILLVSAIIVLIIKRQMRTEVGKLSLSIFKLHLPLFGKFILKAELSRFTRTLELLIRNGVSILKALDVAIPVVSNEIIRNYLRQSYKELEQGGSFGKSLKDTTLFPPFMSNLIIVGEESGRLEEALAEVAGCYERDTDETIRIISSLLEPLMILGMGLIVGFIVVAMLLPIFQINVMAR